MNKRGRIDRVIEHMIRGHPYVSVFDVDSRFIHTSEQLALAANMDRADIIGRGSHEFDDSSWRDEVYGDTDVQERLFVEFAFEVRRKNAPADQAICRLRCKEFLLEFEGSPGVYVMFANVVPASGKQPRLINLLNASDFESG